MISKERIRQMLDIADIKTSARLMLLVIEIVELQADLKALAEIENELIANMEKFPDWMLQQMQISLESNFEYMQYKLEETGRIALDDDCRFQKPLLDAVKAQRAKLAEGTTNGNMLN